MIYVLAALLPPIGLLLNGQPFSAIFNLILIVFSLVFGLIFHILLLVPSAHAVIAVHVKREQRMHREVVDAIRRHGPERLEPADSPQLLVDSRSCCRRLNAASLIGDARASAECRHGRVRGPQWFPTTK